MLWPIQRRGNTMAAFRSRHPIFAGGGKNENIFLYLY
jgi:hypothetical protein